MIQESPRTLAWPRYRGLAFWIAALSETKLDPTFFVDKDFHNIGTGIIRPDVAAMACKAEAQLNSGNMIDVDRAAIQSDLSVLGRFLVTKKSGGYRVLQDAEPGNVLITAPYFHDGSQATLWDVMDHYNKGNGIKDVIRSEKQLGAGEGGKNEDDEYFDLLPNI